MLREQIRVYADLVRLGDIFENAGPAADAPVFRSPDLGTQGVVAAKRIAAAAHRHGLEWSNPGGINQVSVERPGRFVPLDEIRKAIADRAAGEMDIAQAGDLDVTLERRARGFYVHPRLRSEVVVKRLHLRRETGAFEAAVGFAEDNFGAPERIYRGRVQETIEVPVPAHPIERGDTMSRDDVKMLRVPTAQVRTGTVMAPESLAGMAAKRALRADQPVTRTDIERPKLVLRGALVTIVYEAPGLQLKAQGRAQADAADGASVPVLNTRSNRVIQAVVRGPGLVAVDPSAPRPDPQNTASLPRTGRTGPGVVR